jgi:uncharacterized protein DUF4124
MKSDVRFVMASLAWSVSIGVLPGAANAGELFKCRTQDGRILYSDTACEKAGASKIGTVDTSQIDSGGTRRAPDDASRGAKGSDSKRTDSGKNTARDPQARHLREGELQQILENSASTIEQKAAAQEELASIPGAGVCKLTDEERQARESAFTDLAGPRYGRAAARAALRKILGSCERV